MAKQGAKKMKDENRKRLDLLLRIILISNVSTHLQPPLPSPPNEKANLGHDLQLFQFLRVSCLASTPRAATPSKFRGGRSSRGSKLAPPQVDLTGRQQVSHAFTWSDIFLDD